MTTNKLAAIRVQGHEQRKNDITGFHASGFLAKWPIIGTIMFLFGIILFSGLVYNLDSDGPLLKWDILIANTLPAIGLRSPAYVKVFMEAGYYIGNLGLMVLGVLISFYFITKRLWQELVMLTIGMAGDSLLFYFLSNYFARARPPTQIWNILNIPGFPSGHAAAVVVIFGLLAYLLVPNTQSAFWKTAVVVTAIFLIVFVGFTRVFTGGHYLTDVLAGYAIGIAWSGLAYTLIEIYFQKRRSLNVKKG
jgi:membrane-associated phospholipid phosphatase